MAPYVICFIVALAHGYTNLSYSFMTYSITKIYKRDAQGNESSKIELPSWLSFDKFINLKIIYNIFTFFEFVPTSP